MNDTEKQRYYQQLQERLSNKEKELMDPVLKKIETTIKKILLAIAERISARR